MLDVRDIPLPVRNQLRAMDGRKKENILKASQIAEPVAKELESSQTKLKHKSAPAHSRSKSPEKPAKQVNGPSSLSSRVDKADNPVAYAKMLEKEHSTVLSVDKVKRLRQLIRAESSGWLKDFFKAGGYEGLCDSLSEILRVEWRCVVFAILQIAADTRWKRRAAR